MQTITKHLTLLALLFIVQLIHAQDTIPIKYNKERVEALHAFKETIKNQERDFLKNEVEAINLRLERNEITNIEADSLKTEMAKKRALNIENRIALVDNQIALLERNDYGVDMDAKQNLFGVNISNRSFNIKGKRNPVKGDIRTSNDLLFAIGFNNAIIEGESFDDSPYKKGAGSGFVELGWNWKTRLLKNSNFARLKYGLSLQWNKLDLKDNRYFLQNGDVTALETFPINLNKSKFRVTNLVIPVHFEFGPSKVLEKGNRIRYLNNNKFKIGLGGYAGINIGNLQKLKYDENGSSVKQKIKQDYNTNDFVYGLSGYVGLGDTSLYVKYDLSPIFNDQVVKQNNISVGVRFDVD